jgi:hypothetical protein
MNTTIGSFRPCCWEDVDDDCLAPALPDSLWCAKHTAWAQRGYDPGTDALNNRRNLPPTAAFLPSPAQSGEQNPYPGVRAARPDNDPWPTPTELFAGRGQPSLPSPGSGEGPGVRGRSPESPGASSQAIVAAGSSQPSPRDALWAQLAELSGATSSPDSVLSPQSSVLSRGERPGVRARPSTANNFPSPRTTSQARKLSRSCPPPRIQHHNFQQLQVVKTTPFFRSHRPSTLASPDAGEGQGVRGERGTRNERAETRSNVKKTPARSQTLEILADSFFPLARRGRGGQGVRGRWQWRPAPGATDRIPTRDSKPRSLGGPWPAWRSWRSWR